jgi:hypothetical protein
VNVKGRHSGTIRYKRKYRKTKEETQRKSTSKPKKRAKRNKNKTRKGCLDVYRKGENTKYEKRETGMKILT